MGQGRVTAWVGSAAAIAVAVLACRQLVGIGDAPPKGPAGTANDAGAEGGFTYGQGACATCVTTSCGTQEMMCAGTPSCAALEACMSSCGTDPTCRAQCGVDHGLGNDGATPAFEACLASSCSTECGLTCGGLAAVFPPATAPACEMCLAAKECALITACAVDPQCQAALRCQFSSRTPDVLLACPTLAGYDAAAPSAPVFGVMPIGGSCSAECSWGADWSCEGHVDWPQVTSGPITIPLSVYDLATSAPMAGAMARLCYVTDPSCGTPLDTQTTGTDGTTVMHRSPTQTLGLYYLDITSPALVPTLVFDTFNISQPQIVVHAAVFTPTDLAQSADLIQVALDPGLATLLVYAFDCRMAFAPDVVFHVDPPGSSQVFYVKGSFPSKTAMATDTSGLAAIPNVAPLPQILTVTAMPLALDGGVSSSVQAFTRDGGISNVYAVPTP